MQSVPEPIPIVRDFGLSALVVGAAALLVALIPFGGFGSWIVAVVALIFAAVSRRNPASRHGLARTGVILAVVALVVGTLLTGIELALVLHLQH